MANESGSKTSIFEGWEKWQIGLAVGAPICLGLAGLWYYRRVSNNDEKKDDQGKPKPTAEKLKPTDPSKKTAGPQKDKDTPLAKAQELKNNGNKMFKQGKYDEAIQLYTQALEVCPPEHAAEISTFYANRAAAYEKLKNPKLVLENCTEAIKLNNKYLKALSRRANAAEQLGDLQLSMEDVTAVCILEDFQNLSSLEMANRVLKTLSETKAKEAFENRRPGLPSKHFIKSYFASFTQDPVLNCFKEKKEEKVSNLPDESGEKKILNVPDSDSAADQPSVNGEPVSPDNSSHFMKACEKLERGEFEEIIPLCRREISVTPPTHYCQLALLLRGTMFCLTSQTEEAMMDFDQLLKEEKLDKKIKVNVLIKRGSLFIARNKQTEGLADFAHATRIDPNNSDIYHHRGHQNILLDRLEDAIRDFESSISFNPDFPNSYVQKSYAEHRRAAAKQSTVKLEKVIKSYEETLKRFPNNADGHSLYAQALCDLGRFDDADKQFETAIRLEPDNANTIVHRALLKCQWKKSIDESVAMITPAIELDAKCEYAYEVLGNIEVQRGDFAKAEELFKKAIDLCRTEMEMTSVFALLHTVKAKLKAAQRLGIPLTANMPSG